MAWIGYAQQDSNQSVRLMAQAGADPGHAAAAELSWGDNPCGVGPVGTAIRTGTSRVIRSGAKDPNMAKWQVEARIHGYGSAAALPMMNQETAFGSINIYSADVDKFNTQELELLGELSSNLSFGILTLRAREEGRRCQDALRNELDRQKTILEKRERLEFQIVQAKKMDAVGKLAGGIAHDFNNLLMIISSYSELMMDKLSDSDPLRRNGEQILKAARRAGELTGQLLAFSRKQVQALRVLDLNAVLEELGKILPGMLGGTIRVAVVQNKKLWPVKADPAQIEQILMNLATNARDAMPQGGQLTIETANVEFDEKYTRSHIASPAGEYVMLAVSDSGIGMDQSVVPHIFEPFFTTKGSGKGTGLGLSTVYGIVKQTGGYVWVYSELGLGTTLKVYLPRARGAEAVGELSSLRELPLRGNETVLIVDDEEPVREATRIFLEQYGYSVLSAKNGRQAVEVARKYPGTIALLVTDVVMPELGGSELAKLLTIERPEIRVLFISGYTESAVLQHGVIDVATCFLQKPFSLKALVTKIRNLLAGSDPPESSIAAHPHFSSNRDLPQHSD